MGRMRSRALIAAIAVLSLLALPGAASAGPGPTAFASYHGCRGIVDAGPTGMDPADVKGLRARKVSCKRARRVARQWLKPFGNRIEGRFKLFGPWKCASTIGHHEHVRCKARGDKRVRFYLG